MVVRHPTISDVVLIASSKFKVLPTPVEKEVIVDSVCGAAVLRGADIFVPGVLAAHSGECLEKSSRGKFFIFHLCFFVVISLILVVEILQ